MGFRNTLLVLVALFAASCGSGGGSGGSGGATSAVPTPTPTPTPSPTPTNPAYVGCYVDNSNRALPNELIDSDATMETCLAAAISGDYAYAGLQYGSQCFAGNTLGFTLAPDTDCNMTCDADTTETCGGSWRNSVYSTGVGTPAPAPTPGPLPAGSAYVGCYVDDSRRALPNELIDSNSTVEDCITTAQAAGYTYAGLQYGGQCFAGNTLGLTSAPNTDCNMPCDANDTETCGGSWRNSIYSTGN